MARITPKETRTETTPSAEGAEATRTVLDPASSYGPPDRAHELGLLDRSGPREHESSERAEDGSAEAPSNVIPFRKTSVETNFADEVSKFYKFLVDEYVRGHLIEQLGLKIPLEATSLEPKESSAAARSENADFENASGPRIH